MERDGAPLRTWFNDGDVQIQQCGIVKWSTIGREPAAKDRRTQDVARLVEKVCRCHQLEPAATEPSKDTIGPFEELLIP